MCSIIGSFDTNIARKLCKINNYRGALSHSITYIDLAYEVRYIQRSKGEINLDLINIPENHYCIIHQQAPTQQSNHIHPAEFENNLLWHNGILKSNTIQRLQKDEDEKSEWDTYLLLKHLDRNRVPQNIDGSFACLLLDNCGELFAFRNEIVPLFYDEYLNISSTKYQNMVLFQPNILYTICLNKKQIEYVDKFETINNPYWIPEETE
jgi:hypothetical protein